MSGSRDAPESSFSPYLNEGVSDIVRIYLSSSSGSSNAALMDDTTWKRGKYQDVDAFSVQYKVLNVTVEIV